MKHAGCLVRRAVANVIGAWLNGGFRRLYIAPWTALLLSMICGSSLASAAIAVGASGQASYGLPIAVPPGVAGMAPNLSLAYSDGGVNGPLGVGWSAQGGSTITRCGSRKVIDGAPRAVDFSGSDRLCLDGQRLIQTDVAGGPCATQSSTSTGPCAIRNADAAGLAGSNVREFQTEKDSFARIRAYGSVTSDLNDGPATFRVWTKSGQVYEYGRGKDEAVVDSNALILGRSVSTPSRVFAKVWAVRQVKDTVNNYISFRYDQRDTTSGSGATSAGETGRVGEPLVIVMINPLIQRQQC